MSRRTKQIASVLVRLATLSSLVLFSSNATITSATTEQAPTTTEQAQATTEQVQATKEQVLLSNLSQQYFKTVNSAWVEKSSPTDIENNVASDALGTTTLLTTRLSERQQERQELAKDGIQFSSSDTKTQVNSIKINDDIATVRATVSVRLTQSNPASDAPSESSYTDEHVLTYRKQQNTWKLESDIVVAPPSDTADIQELPLKTTNISQSATERSVKASEVKPKQALNSADAITTSIPSGLNYQAMANYAIKWAGNYNPDYPKYDNDCTNFVSQALRAGNWPIVDAHPWNYKDTDKWDDYTGFTGPSYTWRVSNYLLAFSVSRTNWLDNIWNGGIGDLLFTDWDPNGKADGTVDHVMMVTHRDSKGMVYISQHTSSRIDIPLTLSIKLAKEQGHTKIVWYGRRT